MSELALFQSVAESRAVSCVGQMITVTWILVSICQNCLALHAGKSTGGERKTASQLLVADV